MSTQEMSFYLRQIVSLMRVKPARINNERSATAKIVISQWKLPIEDELQLAYLEKKLALKENETEVVRTFFISLFSFKALTFLLQ